MEDKIRLGIIGGSGVYSIEGLSDVKKTAVSTPFGDPSDKLITGTLDGNSVAFLPRHGQGHRIIPAGINYRANIWALKKMGAEMIVSVSAVGSMKEDIHPGDIVVVDQFVDITRSRVSTFFGNGLVGHVSFSRPVCPLLAELLSDTCRSAGIRSHPKGTYICIDGPQFSTFAESCIYRSWGVDVIGMTAATEAKLAREAEICYSAMALVTDYDCWNTDHEAVTMEAVVTQMKVNVINAKKILEEVIPVLLQSGKYRECPCRSSLSVSIQTRPESVSPEMKEKLKLLTGKYLK